ncbi:Galactose binding lectin domain-containing protein [Flavobacterium segetis]|uniref:Galactose binding lectin domain-containing protein n=1 Tax=Flavobacterium segetis TaxID=271157 RepID=A0A1M5FFU3_9FLAO|nr:T9SS sorting signal type C domain-containing protein [Flavobacterium segetis]SHF90447.1 Galactose binding lectin domain-containing protein [Flavobacterium segetis]
MNKKLLFLLVLFFTFFLSFAQCDYPSTAKSVGTYTFCIDGSTTTLNSANVGAGQYALVNVVSGFNYTFSVGNINNGGEIENLTLFNAATDAFLLGGFNSGSNSASITYTATFSGQIKILFSRSSPCINSGGNTGPITLKLNTIGNTQDDQTTFGTGNWVGHVYNWTGTAPPGGASPTALATSNPFSSANYVGYYNVATESINENFGGDNTCFPVLSNGVNRAEINTQTFAVRYRMRSTRPAGCYVMNVNGDDGVRVYIDGVRVFDRWVEQSNTTYCNNLVNLNANSEIVLDYYENAGQNVLGFSLLPFDGTGNNISSPQNVTVCSNTATTLIGSNLISCNPNPTTVYQWQSSTDNINFTDISGATVQNYNVPAVTVVAGNPNNVRYFRRVFKPSTLTAGTCEFFTSAVTVTTSGARPNAPSSIIGSSTQCTNTTAGFSIAAVPNAVNYNWSTTGTGWTITQSSNGLSVSIAFSATATSGNLIVFAANGCGQSFSNSSVNVQVRPLPTSASISGTTSVCVGPAEVPITFINPQNYGVRVTYNINGGSNLVVFVGANASINYIKASTNAPGVFVYNLISVGNETDFPTCLTNITGSATVTVNSPSTAPTSVTGTTTICAGGSTSLTVSGGSLGIGATARWFTASCGGTLIASGNTITVSPGTTTTYFVRYEGACNTTACVSATVTVNSSIINNNLSYTNGASGPRSATVNENGNATLSAPAGTYFATVNFASYGTPDGTAPNFTLGTCHAATSQTVAETAFLGNSTATIPATNAVFGDPCIGTGKRLYILASYVQAICSGATVTINGSTPAGGTDIYIYQWQSSTTSATTGFVNASGTSTSRDYTTGAITQDTWFRRVVTSCNSSNTSYVVLVKVNAAIPMPTVTATIQPNCVTATGSVNLSGLPTENWIITASPNTAGLTGLTGTAVTTTIGGLTAGTTYTFTVSNGTCTSSASANVVLNPVISTTWNGSTWSSPPTLDKLGLISSNTPITADVELCNCTVNTGVNASVATGITLKLLDRLMVNGTLTFENNASLVQNNNVVNSGNIIYIRETAPTVRVSDYTYWSTPVAPIKLAGSGGISYQPSSLAGSIFYSFTNNTTSSFWQSASASTVMELGKGYIIRGPISGIPPTPGTLVAKFEGVPNNGNITAASGIVGNRSYLVGNPYPSAIYADKFLVDNKTALFGTLYFWTRKTEIGTSVSNPGSGTFAYSSDDYATYNLTGGVGTGVGTRALSNQVNGTRPSGEIAAGQGFFATSLQGIPSGTNIIFNNQMRIGLNDTKLNNSQFFRTSKSNSKSTSGIEKNRIWLNLTNSGGAFKQLLVGYITGATNEYDSSYDGYTFSANQYINFYSVLDNNALTIQGRALPFNENDTVPLGYVSSLIGEFSISIDEVDGDLKSKDIFIEDKILNIIHDLKVAPYTFSTVTGTFNDRFVLRYTTATLATTDFDKIEAALIIAKDRNELKIKSAVEVIKRITIFDLQGKKVFDKSNINDLEFRSSTISLFKQVGIVKVTLTSGQVMSKKVAF